MDARVIFHDNIDDDPSDFTRLEAESQNALDRVVNRAIVGRQAYSGFATVKTGPTTIETAPGEMWSGGKRYIRPDVFTKDFQTALPLAGRKIVALVVWGDEVDTEVRPRQFLINAETLQSEAQSVPMIRQRICNINTQAGEEAPDPTAPIVGPNYVIVALITLSTGGVDTIVMQSANEVPNLDELSGDLEDLSADLAGIRPKLQTLESDLASLANSLKGNASQGTLTRAIVRLAVLESKLNIPNTAQDSHANYYLTGALTDLAHPLSRVKVEEGIRFPDVALNDTVLSIFDPLNPRAMIKNGMLFPAYNRALWLDTGAPTGEVRISSFSYQTHEMVQKTVARERIRYGNQFTVCTNSLFWQQGVFDPIAGIFKIGTETFKAALDLNGLPWVYTADNQFHAPVRLQQFWTDTVSEAYWNNITVDHTVSGAQVIETWQQGQDMWLDAIGLFFTRLAATGNVDISICTVDKNGLPDIKSVISTTTLQRADMKQGDETVIPLVPTFLEAGKRYAVLITTGADHWLATVPGENFTRGTFFTVLDGAYAQGDGTRDLQMKLYRASFQQARSVIELGSLQLVGGILGIDIIAATIVPGSTTLNYEVQVAGQWYPLSEVTVNLLSQGGSQPPLLPLRAVFNGSADMMPMIQLVGSRVRVSRPDVTFREISPTFTPPGSITKIVATYRLEYFNSAYHTVTARLLTGGPAFTTETAPSSFVDVVDPIDGAVERTYTWNIAASNAPYKLSLAGTTSSVQKIFHGAFRKDYNQ